MNALSIHNLVKIYKNGFQALKGVNFEVQAGDFFALLGPNGAGKTTLIGIISSLITKTSGNITVFGNELDTDPIAVKSNIGLVPQEFNFHIFEQVEAILINQAGFYGLPRKIASHRAEKYLKQLELWDKRHQPARTLSGGMKRRLMIARALMHEPKLLILDEPTAGVDIEIRRSMWQFLRDINNNGTTIILTTHYLEEAENLCRNIAIINNGNIIENTSMNKLLTKLNLETFILYVKDPLLTIPSLSQFPVRLIDSTTLEVDLHAKQTMNDLFTTLSQHNIQVLRMRNKTNRLEELFINLIGKQSDAYAN